MAELPQIDLKAFGEKLRAIRKSQNLSAEMLANMAELERVQISRIELGKTNPKLSTVIAIAKALGISPAQLFD